LDGTIAQFKDVCVKNFSVLSIWRIQLYIAKKPIVLKEDSDIIQLKDGDQISLNCSERIFPNTEITETTYTESLLKLFLCPISHDIMTDPVIAKDGFTYERKNIKLWFESHDTSPLTSVVLSDYNLTTNQTLRASIKDYLESKASQL
jgi:hypothetical protein